MNDKLNINSEVDTESLLIIQSTVDYFKENNISFTKECVHELKVDAERFLFLLENNLWPIFDSKNNIYKIISIETRMTWSSDNVLVIIDEAIEYYKKEGLF